MYNIDLTPILQALIGLICALITYKLIPWIKSKTTAQQQQNLETAARIAVYAAEQIFRGNANVGSEKFAYALRALEDAGFDADTTMACEAIEKAVYELMGHWRLYPPDVMQDPDGAEPEREAPEADDTHETAAEDEQE